MDFYCKYFKINLTKNMCDERIKAESCGHCNKYCDGIPNEKMKLKRRKPAKNRKKIKKTIKLLNSPEFLTATNILNGTSFMEIEDNLLPMEFDIEKECIKKNSYDSLSTEAKTVIDMVINSPSEIMNLIYTPKVKSVSKEAEPNLKKYFQKKFGDATKNIFKEIKNYVNEL